MKTSARNQFAGTVSRVQEGAINAEIELTLAGGQKIVAMITRESMARLNLHPGKPAVAFVKASSIVLVTESEDMIFSTRNNRAGTVAQLNKDEVNSEVIVNLTNGGTVAATVTSESAKALGLAPGVPVSAIFKASSVILGTPA